LVLACQQAPYWGVASVSTVVMLVVAFHLLATFVLVELHCREPMVDLRSVKRAVVWGALVGVGTMECASVAISVFLMLYLQEVRNLSPLTASLILLPKGVGSILVSGLTGRLTDRGAGRWLIAGGLAGAVVTLMWLSWGAEHRQTVLLVPALFLFGLARALTTPAASTLPMSVLPHRVHGVAASLSVAARQLSGVVGLAVLSSLLAAVQWTNRNHLLHSGGYTARQQQAIDSLLFDHDHSPLLAAVPPALHPPIIAAADQAFISGLQAVLVATSALLLLIALVAAVVIPAPQTSP
jgi:predicted MFS family arabinose efflux permease